ncbi:MAG: AMP-binding protein [Bacteroidales bacterium]|nr:AMP-binding protein [Bacteroidales bacterium]
MIRNHGSKAAVLLSGRTISYDELIGSILHFASLYEVEAGERVVIFSTNRLGYIPAFYSAWQHRAIAVPIDFMATVDEVAYMLADCTPKVVFCGKEQLEVILRAMEAAASNAKLILIDEHEEALRPAGNRQLVQADLNQTAVLIYTSGTTGSPKGVMLSFANLLHNVDAVSKHIPIFKGQSRVMVLLPLHHIFPLMGTMVVPLYVGASIAISPSMASEDIMATLHQNKITIIIGVPRLYAAIRKGIMDKINQSFAARNLFRLAEKLQSPAFSRKVFGAVHKKLGGAVESLVSGGAALDPAVGQDFKTLGFDVLEGYGMTEAAPMITFTRPGRVVIGSPGEAMHGTSIRIVDGEITASGGNIMQGYFGKPEETAEVLKEGWLFTGDLGYLDKKGFLYITGRKKEIIVLSNGKNVSPAELEDELMKSPMLSDAGVFYANEQIQAILVPKPEYCTGLNEEAIEKLLRTQVIEPFNSKVSTYKKIMGIRVIHNELPRTRLGKLQRFKLADLAKKEEMAIDNETEQPMDEVYALIARYLEKEKERRVKPSHHLEFDLGLDSLDKVSFQSYLQQTFGVSPEPHQMAGFSDVRSLSQWVNQRLTRIEEAQVNWKDILHEKVTLKLPETWLTGHIALWLSRAFFKTYFRFKSTGMEKIPDGPCILAPNHQSFFDGLFVASYLRFGQVRKTYFYAKEKHIRQAWLKFLANRNNIIIMDLNNNLKESIQKMGEVLKSNKKIIIFPEGTRTFNGKMGDFKKTFAILSRELNVPIVPVSIKGAFEALPRGHYFPRPWKKISVEFLDPIHPGQHTYESLSQLVKSKIQLRQA